jgi:hypothetical protein
MSVSFGANDSLTNLSNLINQIGQSGTYTPQMKLPKPKPPAALQPFQGLDLGNGATGGVTAGTGAGGGSVDRLMKALRAQESTNNYGAVNHSSNALGAYQILASNLPEWSQQALGHVVSASQFLSSPSIQDAIARYKLSQLVNQRGLAGAAATWYGGDYGYNHMYDKTPQNGYPSMYDYLMSVLSRY